MAISVTGLSGLMNRSIKLTYRKVNGFLCLPTSDDAPNGWGEPFEDENGEPIVPGTPGGSNRFVALKKSGDGSWAVSRGFAGGVGNINWFGPPPKKEVISWQGSFGRCIPPEHTSASGTGYYAEFEKITQKERLVRWSRYFYRGKFRIEAPGAVVGAALQTIIENGVEVGYLVCITTNVDLGIATDKVHRLSLTDNTWTEVFSWTHPENIGIHETGWFINQSGTEARCILREWLVDSGSGSQYYINHQYVLDLVNLTITRINGPSIISSKSFVSTWNCDGAPYSTYEESSSTTSGSEIVGVDFKGDTPVLAVVNVTSSGSFVQQGTDPQTEEGGLTESINTSSSGGYSLSFGGISLEIRGGPSESKLTWDVVDGEFIETKSSSDTTIRKYLYFLDLRFDEAIYVEHVTSRIFSVADYTETTSWENTYKLISTSVGILASSSDSTSETKDHPLDGDWLITPYCVFVPENTHSTSSSDEVVRQASVYAIHSGRMIEGTREYTKAPIAAFDPNGNLFYSIPHDAFWKIPGGFSHFLTNGNPIILTEVVGDNPRFYPITVI